MVRPKRSSSVKSTKVLFKEARSHEGSDIGNKRGSQQPEAAAGSVGSASQKTSGNHDHVDNNAHVPENGEAAVPITPIARRPPHNKGKGKKRSRASEWSTDDEDAEDVLPSSKRKTDKGGYAHTKASRARIGKANKGKSPWNKGKNRSEEVKAKIRAGVVARNRADLLAKLEKLGISENDWHAKQKEIKYLRERVRRAKHLLSKRQEQSTLLKLQQQLDEALASTTEPSTKINAGTKIESDQPQGPVPTDAPHSNEEEEKDEQHAASVKNGHISNTNTNGNNCPVSLLQKEIIWEPHTFHATEIPRCVNGGPGGLICCAKCTSLFSQFLTATGRDAERQTRHHVGKEVQEVMGYVQESRFAIMTALQVARNHPIPSIAVNFGRPSASGKRHANDGAISAEDMEWTMTSVMDLANRGEHDARI